MPVKDLSQTRLHWDTVGSNQCMLIYMCVCVGQLFVTMGRSMRRIYSTHLCQFVNELIVQNTNNGQCVSEDFGGFIGTDNGWKVVLESNHISQLSHCLLPLCVWEKAGKHTHTHAAQQSAEEMKKNSSNANNSKTLSCFFQRASSHIDMYYFNDE